MKKEEEKDIAPGRLMERKRVRISSGKEVVERQIGVK